ncbi:hypothetical protein Tco_1071626 [Tanacetum coccineum]
MKVLLLQCECRLLDVMMKQGYSDQRGRLVTSIDNVKKSSERIAECRESMLESQLVKILLMRQRLHESMQQANTTVHREYNADRSKKTSSGMSKRIN